VQLKEMEAGIPNLLAAAPSVSPNLENPWDGLMLTACIAAYGPQHEGFNAPGLEGYTEYDQDGCRKSPLTQTLEQYGASLIRMLSLEEDVNDVAVLSKRGSDDDSTATFYTFVQVDAPTRAKWWSLADAIVANPLEKNGTWYTFVHQHSVEGSVRDLIVNNYNRVVTKSTRARIDWPPVPIIKLENGLDVLALEHYYNQHHRKKLLDTLAAAQQTLNIHFL
jgi:hypothetical protein